MNTQITHKKNRHFAYYHEQSFKVCITCNDKKTLGSFGRNADKCRQCEQAVPRENKKPNKRNVFKIVPSKFKTSNDSKVYRMQKPKSLIKSEPITTQITTQKHPKFIYILISSDDDEIDYNMEIQEQVLHKIFIISHGVDLNLFYPKDKGKGI